MFSVSVGAKLKIHDTTAEQGMDCIPDCAGLLALGGLGQSGMQAQVTTCGGGAFQLKYFNR